jgi:hypothetical protein
MSKQQVEYYSAPGAPLAPRCVVPDCQEPVTDEVHASDYSFALAARV